MASTLRSDSLEDLCECPVCFEPYKDPRLLKCGHQFCEKCLKDIADHTPQRHLPCPVCREVTKPQHGDVTTLPRSTLHQYMQELAFRKPTEEALGQKCTKCKVNKPTRHCLQCTADLAYMCDTCYEVHQKIRRWEKHETVQFDPLLICPNHKHKMVEHIYYDCSTVACTDCMFDKHADHETENLDAATEKALMRLNDFITKLDESVVDKKIIHHLKYASNRSEDVKKRCAGNIEYITDAWKKLEAKLDKAFTEMSMTVKDGLPQTSMNQAKIAEVTVAQQKMLKLAENLLEGASDPEVIMGSRDLPEPDIGITEVVVRMPMLGMQFAQIASDIQEMADTMDIRFKKEVYTIKRGKKNAEWNLKHDRDINIESFVLGLSFIEDELLVRVDDSRSPIRIYDQVGRLKNQFAKGASELVGQPRQVSMDTHRNLYLIPSRYGFLVRMKSDGTLQDKTRLGVELYGVAYIADQDLYVLSDCVDRLVLLVSPVNLTVVKTLGGKEMFSKPQNICVGDINGSTTIVVSDWHNETLYLYSITGDLIKTHYPWTDIGRLRCPWGVSIDRSGCIVVCDRDNYRVLRVWSDKDGDHWECLLDKEQLGGRPRCVDINNDNRLMAVSVDNTIKIYKF